MRCVVALERTNEHPFTLAGGLDHQGSAITSGKRMVVSYAGMLPVCGRAGWRELPDSAVAPQEALR